MAQLVKGPFDIQWGLTVLAAIETLNTTYNVKSTDYDSVQGITYTNYGAHKVEIEATFLETDVASLAAVLPQYHVANGGTLSTGEIVSDPDGAIDVVPGGNQATQYHDLIIRGAGSPAEIARIINAYTEISGVELDGTIRKIKVKFSGSASVDTATIQFFKSSAISVIS
jgi:hypothetical protein